MTGGPFTILCSKAPFSMDELEIFRRYGREFERLSHGERAPATAAQEQFVEAARGEIPQKPSTNGCGRSISRGSNGRATRPTGHRWGRSGACRTTARTGVACAERAGAMSDDGR